MVVTIRNSSSSSNRTGVGFGAMPMPLSENVMRKSSIGTNTSPASKNKSNFQSTGVSFLRDMQQQRSSKSIKDPSTPTMGSAFSSRASATKLPRASIRFDEGNENTNIKNDSRKTRTGGFNSVIFNHEKYAAQSKHAFQRSQQQLIVDINAVAVPPVPKRGKKRKVVNKRRGANLLQKALIRASTNVSERAHQLINDLEDSRRQQTAKERISECLIHLRAASERSHSLREYQEEFTWESPDGDERSVRTKRSDSLRNVVGDIGLALFSPLDLEAFEPLNPSKTPERCDDEMLEDDTTKYPVYLMPESPSALVSCPRLLSPRMLEQLVADLPPAVKTMTWKRLFALGRDGDSFEMMLDRVHTFTNTIVVVETTWGHILGGYASAPWDRQGGMTRSFYGSGQSFLFANHPDEDGSSFNVSDDDDDTLHVYKWTGNNNYCQVCDVDDGQLAMGGGGAFGLIVEENFSKGSTGRCSTFGNPALIPASMRRKAGGTFDVLNMEIYGFSSMVEAFIKAPVVGVPKQKSLLSQD